MTILLTGGTGRTSLAIAQRLHASDVAFRILSRSGSAPAPYQGCRFDWTDTSTWNAAFEQAVNVDAVYLVVPVIEHVETGEPIKAYIDFLKSKGVERFVLLSASNVAPGTRIMGLIHQHLRSIQADYVVLRPTWYMGTKDSPHHMTPTSILRLTWRVPPDNFSRNQAASIKSDGKIYSGAQDGKIPWISCDDVGAVGFCALTGTSKAAGKLVDPILLGPELLSYDDVSSSMPMA